METNIKQKEKGINIPKIDQKDQKILNSLDHNIRADLANGSFTNDDGEEIDLAPPKWNVIDSLPHNKKADENGY